MAAADPRLEASPTKRPRPAAKGETPITERYNSVDDAITSLKQTWSLTAAIMRNHARATNDPKRTEQLAKIEALFADDCQLLRRQLEKIQKPDGSIEFLFSPEAAQIWKAWKALKEHGRAG